MLTDLPTYVINLDRRPDRWQHTRLCLQQQGFSNVNRISAVDGVSIPAQQIKDLVEREAYLQLNKPRRRHEDLGSLGAVGCYLSHVMVWKQVVSSGMPSIVMEDDANFVTSFQQYDILHKFGKMCQGYDFVVLGFSKLRSKTLVKGNNVVLPLQTMFFGTGFYYITPDGASKLLQTAFPIKVQVDSYMGLKALQLQVKAGVHLPSLTHDSNFGTDIQTNPCIQCDEEEQGEDRSGSYMRWLFVAALVVAVLTVCHFRYPR